MLNENWERQLMIARSKRERYTDYLQRADEARHNGYHFEATWIYYGILEDRLVSAIEELSSSYNNWTWGKEKKQKTPQMLGAKVNLIKQQDALVTEGFFFKDLLQDIEDWAKDSRNRLMHELGRLDVTDEDLKKLSGDGERLAKATAKAVMSLKKQTKKQLRQSPSSL